MPAVYGLSSFPPALDLISFDTYTGLFPGHVCGRVGRWSGTIALNRDVCMYRTASMRFPAAEQQCVRTPRNAEHGDNDQRQKILIFDCRYALLHTHCLGYTPGTKGSDEPAHVREFYERAVFPKLGPHQRAAVVPGLFGCSNATVTAAGRGYGARQGPGRGGRGGGGAAPPPVPAPPLAQQSAQLLAKLQGYWVWFRNDSRLAGIVPWHFSTRPGRQSDGQYCDMRLGASSFPELLAQLRTIGREINANTSGARAALRSHVPNGKAHARPPRD